MNPTPQQLTEMAYLLQVVPRGETVSIQWMETLKRQYLAAHAVADAQPYDAAIEAVRKGFCALPRFSFHLNRGSVRRVADRSGNWVEFDQAHALFDPVAVDALVAKDITQRALDKASA